MGSLFVAGRYFIGFIRTLIYYLLYLKSINIKNISKCFLNCQITIRKKGKLIIDGGILVYPGTLINIFGGVVRISKGVAINRNCLISSHKEIIIGANTLIGPNVSIFDHDHKIINNELQRSNFSKESINIGSNVWIGANSIIGKGITIGDNVIIGAGSIVTKDIPSNTKFVQKRY